MVYVEGEWEFILRVFIFMDMKMAVLLKMR